MSNVSLIDGHIDEPRMTDTDIIKTLSEFYDLNLLIEPNTNEIITFGDVLDLINRKDAEIERLQTEIEKLRQTPEVTYTQEFKGEAMKKFMDDNLVKEMVGE